jgi:hypothetical protein
MYNPDHVLELVGKVGVAEALKGADPMRLQAAHRSGIAQPVQWVASSGGLA